MKCLVHTPRPNGRSLLLGGALSLYIYIYVCEHAFFVVTEGVTKTFPQPVATKAIGANLFYIFLNFGSSNKIDRIVSYQLFNLRLYTLFPSRSFFVRCPKHAKTLYLWFQAIFCSKINPARNASGWST